MKMPKGEVTNIAIIFLILGIVVTGVIIAQRSTGVNITGEINLTGNLNATNVYATQDVYNSEGRLYTTTQLPQSNVTDWNNDIDLDANMSIEGWLLLESGEVYFSTISELNGTLTPALDNQFDLGNSTHRWKDLYLSNNVVCSECIDDADVSDTLTCSDWTGWDGVSGLADANVSDTLTASTLASGATGSDLSLSGVLDVSVANYPIANFESPSGHAQIWITPYPAYDGSIQFYGGGARRSFINMDTAGSNYDFDIRHYKDGAHMTSSIQMERDGQIIIIAGAMQQYYPDSEILLIGNVTVTDGGLFKVGSYDGTDVVCDTAGTIFFNSTSNEFMGCDGTSWEQLSP